jgi:NAD(P)-dependent dehydrogenase (short-subunit alcohol dehydrogenase family)
MSSELTGSSALVTGGTSGIGRAAALSLARARCPHGGTVRVITRAMSSHPTLVNMAASPGAESVNLRLHHYESQVVGGR